MFLKFLLQAVFVLFGVSTSGATEESGKITKVNVETRTIDFDSETSEGPFGSKDQVQVPKDLKIRSIRRTTSGKVETIIKFEDLKVGDHITVLIPLMTTKKGLVAGQPVGLIRNEDKSK